MLKKIGYFNKFDWVLLGTTLTLVGFGLMALYSTSLGNAAAAGAANVPITSSADFANFWKQIVFAGIGVLVMFLLPMFNYRMLFGMAKFLYVAAALVLIAVLIFGQEVRGTTGWFGIAGFGIQPVEIVKIFLIIYLAKFFSMHARNPDTLRKIIISGLAVAGLVGLVLLQPDLGSALLLISIWVGMLLLSGVKRSYVFAAILAAIVGAVIVWSFVLQPYQKERISVFIDPDRDPLGRGYNVTQSIIAIGSGEFLGRGLGFGSQSQLRFLPERQTDFIFAVVAEEMGFLGVLILITVFGTFFFRCYRLARGAHDDFTVFLVLGITTAIAVEALVNMGANLRLLPVTGVTLPFLSYGGSSLLSKFLMVGILQSISVRK